MNITQKYIPIGKRRSGRKLLGTVRFIVAHDTGNDGSTALQNVNYYINSFNEVEASAHSFVDDKGVIECIPLDERALHVRNNQPKDNELFGGNANDYAIGVELCYSTKGKFDSEKAYANYVKYIADLCKEFKLDPTKHIVGHFHLDPERRTDPLNAFNTIGRKWDHFIADIAQTLKQIEKPIIKPTVSDVCLNELKETSFWNKIKRFIKK